MQVNLEDYTLSLTADYFSIPIDVVKNYVSKYNEDSKVFELLGYRFQLPDSEYLITKLANRFKNDSMKDWGEIPEDLYNMKPLNDIQFKRFITAFISAVSASDNTGLANYTHVFRYIVFNMLLSSDEVEDIYSQSHSGEELWVNLGKKILNMNLQEIRKFAKTFAIVCSNKTIDIEAERYLLNYWKSYKTMKSFTPVYSWLEILKYAFTNELPQNLIKLFVFATFFIQYTKDLKVLLPLITITFLIAGLGLLDFLILDFKIKRTTVERNKCYLFASSFYSRTEKINSSDDTKIYFYADDLNEQGHLSITNYLREGTIIAVRKLSDKEFCGIQEQHVYGYNLWSLCLTPKKYYENKIGNDLTSIDFNFREFYIFDFGFLSDGKVFTQPQLHLALRFAVKEFFQVDYSVDHNRFSQDISTHKANAIRFCVGYILNSRYYVKRSIRYQSRFRSLLKRFTVTFDKYVDLCGYNVNQTVECSNFFSIEDLKTEDYKEFLQSKDITIEDIYNRSRDSSISNFVKVKDTIPLNLVENEKLTFTPFAPFYRYSANFMYQRQWFGLQMLYKDQSKTLPIHQTRMELLRRVKCEKVNINLNSYLISQLDNVIHSEVDPDVTIGEGYSKMTKRNIKNIVNNSVIPEKYIKHIKLEDYENHTDLEKLFLICNTMLVSLPILNKSDSVIFIVANVKCRRIAGRDHLHLNGKFFNRIVSSIH